MAELHDVAVPHDLHPALGTGLEKHELVDLGQDQYVTFSELDAMVALGDVQGLEHTFAAASAGERQEFATWYRQSGRKAARERAKAKQESALATVTVEQLLTVEFSDSMNAIAQLIPWGRWAYRGSHERREILLRSLSRRGREWCSNFLTSAPVLRGEPIDNRGDRGAMLLPLMVHFDLEPPRDGNFATSWASWVGHRMGGLDFFKRNLDHYFNVEHHRPGRSMRVSVDQVWLEPDGSTRWDDRALESITLADLIGELPHAGWCFSQVFEHPTPSL